MYENLANPGIVTPYSELLGIDQGEFAFNGIAAIVICSNSHRRAERRVLSKRR